MKELHAAIKQKFDASSLVAICVGGYHRSRPDSNVLLPYIVMSTPPVGQPQEMTRPSDRDTVILRFQAWSNDDETADDLADKMERVFAPKFGQNDPLAVANHVLLRCVRVNRDVFEEPDRNPRDGRPVWQTLIDVEYTIQEFS